MNELWAMLESYLGRYLQDLEAVALLRAELQSTNPTLAASLLDDDDGDEDEDIMSVDAQGVAHIQIQGVLTPQGPSAWDRFFGMEGTGYNAICAAMDKCDTDPMVKQVVLHIDSPGGSVAGMESTHNRIRTSAKPVVALNEGLMASAAYGIGSAAGAGNIFSTAASNLTGSIGVQATYIDGSDRMKAAGFKRYSFVSKNAPLKNASPDSKDGAEAIQARIDASERIMHAQIAEARAVSSEYVAQSYGRGDVLVAQDPDQSKPSALKSRMIDGIRNSAPAPAASFVQGFRSQVSQSPAAEAGKPELEVHMTLSEFLAQNPEAKAFFENSLAEAFTKGQKSAEARAVRVGNILASEVYKGKGALHARALACLKGEVTLEAFDNLVAMVDMDIADKKSRTAKKETDELEETPGDQGAVILTVESVGKMTKAELRAVSAEQIKAMSPEVLQAFEKAQIKAVQ